MTDTPTTVRAEKDLDLPADLFNSDGLAVVQVSGGRYGGDWNILFTPMVANDRTAADIWVLADGPAPVDDPGWPVQAIGAAMRWAISAADRIGLRLVDWAMWNDRYSPDERPYFCAAQAIFASSSFVPKPDVVYADDAYRLKGE